MQKIKNFKYLGLNGNITSRVQLVGVEGIPMFELLADPGKILTNGEYFVHGITVYEEEVKEWREIEDKGQN